MSHPTEIEKTNTRRILVLLACLNVIVIAVMQLIGSALKPGNIVCFEFAGSLSTANEMVAAWQNAGVMGQLFFVIGFDYLFMATYGSFLWLACLNLADGPSTGARVLRLIAWLQPVAAVLDAFENIGLYKLAMGVQNEAWATLAFWCAAVKFAFVGLGVIASAIGGVRAFLARK